MSLYRFKTFRTSYYFPSPKKDQEFLYSLYTPFGSKLAKAYWWVFRHCALIRLLNKVKDANSEFPYERIMTMCPKGSMVSFNMGTPGPEQKISMLGLELDGKHFFAKFSVKLDAMALSHNEIRVLTALKGMGIAPELYDYREEKDFCFFRTSCVDGKNPTDLQLRDEIVSLAIRINKCNLTENVSKGEFKTGLSHGDFTPWNMIISNGEYRMIDWEMADERELGYDLFTYITHVAALLMPDLTAIRAIDTNKQYLDKYFKAYDIEDWMPYLKAFARRRVKYDKSKGDLEHAVKFESLL